MKSKEFENDIVFAKFLNYMKRALLHKKINYLRDIKNVIDKEYSISFYENQLVYEEKVNLNLFNFLNEKEKKVLELHMLKKLTYKEIAKTLKLKPESIRKIQYRAIKKIEKRGEYEF